MFGCCRFVFNHFLSWRLPRFTKMRPESFRSLWFNKIITAFLHLNENF
ncbi:hypothetical protein EH198_17680 [Paenibacillus rhizophilus]|uniref:Transposase putative helix-turn-helix domain-containing protein n=1 Tax=Paenibacillus rhizophilus TaxID=1850366 RepID=A0A3N9PU27_9BACL|nr:hypothetical protein EH198_17680 [Paenibacillus rhizophilus]